MKFKEFKEKIYAAEPQYDDYEIVNPIQDLWVVPFDKMKMILLGIDDCIFGYKRIEDEKER